MEYDANGKYYYSTKGTASRRIRYEVGDSQQSARFYPQFKTMHWDDEVNMSIRLVEADYTLGQVSPLALGIGTSWLMPTTGRIARFYEEPSKYEDGGFEIEIEFPSKPASNIIRFSLQTKELDFFYQPALTQAEVDSGAIRAANVVGSYAVYHKSRRDNVIGGKEYRAGKAFHIFRPSAKDALNNRTWCDLNIDTVAGFLTVTVPQAFLDSAIYPVIVDPTFGLTTIGASVTSDAATTVIATNYASPAETGDISSISAYIKIVAAGKLLSVAIYSDSASSPNAKLAEDSGSAAVPTNSESWVTANLTYAFAASTQYWLGQWGNDTYSYWYDTATNQNAYRTSQTFRTWPDPFTKTGFQQLKTSIYATYTATGGATSPGWIGAGWW